MMIISGESITMGCNGEEGGRSAETKRNETKVIDILLTWLVGTYAVNHSKAEVMATGIFSAQGNIYLMVLRKKRKSD